MPGDPATPFRPIMISTRDGETDRKSFDCPQIPSAPYDLQYQSIYQQGDPSASILDDEANSAYLEAMAPLRAFENSLANMANRYVRSNPARSDIAQCIEKSLLSWANQNALLGNANHTGQFVRGWMLSSMATAWAQVENDPQLPPESVQTINQWLGVVSTAVINDFSTKTDRVSRQNNHAYWAAWSVMAAGMAIHNTDMFNWAVDRAKDGINAVQPDGTLPLELARHSRALHYHAYAATPLFMMAETARQKGIDLYSLNNKALDRLGARVVYGIAHPEWFAALTGYEQDTSRVKGTANLVWLELYTQRNPADMDAAALKAQLPPLRASRIGGDASLLYGP